MSAFVSRAGEKLQYALDSFNFKLEGYICADFGSSTGGFVDCLLKAGAKKVYSVDTAYGQLAWELRKDKRVITTERTNAMHVTLPEKVNLITIDTGWTKQLNILPSALNNLKPNGYIITLIKPHYEAEKKDIVKGKLPEELIEKTLKNVEKQILSLEVQIVAKVQSPIKGERASNTEFLFLIKPCSN